MIEPGKRTRLSQSSSGHLRGFAGVGKKKRPRHLWRRVRGRLRRGVAANSFPRAMRKTVEWWAGIGGPMAVEGRKRAGRGKAKRAGTVKKTRKLNKAALKLVDENASAIAQSLLNSTIDGNVVSARLLMDLAEGNVAAGCNGHAAASQPGVGSVCGA